MRTLGERAREKQRERYNRCKVGKFFREQPDLASEVDALIHEGVIARYVWEVLVEDHGQFAPFDSFKRHTGGQCSCRNST